MDEHGRRPQRGPIADPVLGFYGPGSRMWRINREAVLLGAGPAVLLLQVAHPLVAEGVAAHSTFPADAFGRFRRTLITSLDLVFGDGPTAERAVRHLNGIHARVRGEVLDETARGATGALAYRALDPELLLWVQTTLIIMGVRAYRAWVGPLSEADCEAFWQEARSVGVRLGIPRSVSPADWRSLRTWFAGMIAPGGPVVVTPTARRLAPHLVRPPLPLVPDALVDLTALPGLALLPASIREGYGMGWTGRRERAGRWLGRGIRLWTSVVPRDWRAMPQARAAERRAAGSGAARVNDGRRR